MMMDIEHRGSAYDLRGEEGEIFDSYKHHTKNKNEKAFITSSNHCQTELASYLYIGTPDYKLSCDMEFSIGGTYNKEQEDFWFCGSTSVCHGNNYLLKLFVVPRRDVRFSLILVNNGHNLAEEIKVNIADKNTEITGPTKEYIFSTTKKDEVVFIKTYCFSKDDLQVLKQFPLLLPCQIIIHTSYRIHPSVINKIKLQYTVQLNEALYKTRNEGDFIIVSETNNKYPVHLFVAAAHSPVLREVIKSNQRICVSNLSDKDVNILIEFLYNGSIENLSADNAPNILKIADKMGLPGMLKLAQIALITDINKDNAIELAVLAKKYDIKDLLFKVFDYIKQHPELLFSDYIQHLNDIDLMRAMLQHIGNAPCQCDQTQD